MRWCRMKFQRQIAVVYTIPDTFNKVNDMRELGFLEHEIYIFSKNIRELQSLKKYTEINIHQSGDLLDMFKATITGSNLYEVSLHRFQFSEEELRHYGELIRKGAFFIIAQHEYPVEKKPTTYKFSKLSTNVKQVPNTLNVNNKSFRNYRILSKK